MKRLEDIPKKTLFEVPEGYFEKLPGIIQARVAAKEPARAWGTLALRYAMPTVALIAVAVFFWQGPTPSSTEDLLASIDSEQLVAYLQESELNADDLLESIALDPDEINAIEEGAMEDIDMDDVDIEELESEFEVRNN